MKVNKINQLVLDVQSVLDFWTVNEIKKFIGDSTNNNRKLSVNQVLRFLNRQGYQTLFNQLTAVYNETRDYVAMSRVDLLRTDAYEWVELIATLDNMSVFPPFVRSLGQRIRLAA